MNKKLLFFLFLCFALPSCTNETEDVNETDYTVYSIDKNAQQLMKSHVTKKELENNIVNKAWKIVYIGEINIEASNGNGYVLFDDLGHRVSGTVAHNCYFKENHLLCFVDDMAFEKPAFYDLTYSYDENSGGIFVRNDAEKSNNDFAFMYIDKLEGQNLFTIYRKEFNAVPHYYYCHYAQMSDKELKTALEIYTYKIK